MLWVVRREDPKAVKSLGELGEQMERVRHEVNESLPDSPLPCCGPDSWPELALDHIRGVIERYAEACRTGQTPMEQEEAEHMEQKEKRRSVKRRCLKVPKRQALSFLFESGLERRMRLLGF
jgi:hypothetical protein